MRWEAYGELISFNPTVLGFSLKEKKFRLLRPYVLSRGVRSCQRTAIMLLSIEGRSSVYTTIRPSLGDTVPARRVTALPHQPGPLGRI